MEAEKEEGTRQVQKEIKNHQLINNKLAKERIRELKEIEASTLRKIQLEKEWLERKLQLQKEVQDMSTMQICQVAKVHNYSVVLCVMVARPKVCSPFT